jgi:hypothetical protein
VWFVGVALASAMGGFALSTPFFFLDWNTALDSLQAESGLDRDPNHLGLSPLGNLRWYLGTTIPETLTWLLVALAAIGAVFVLWRRRPRQLLLVAFCAIFLAGICASNAHWVRWVIPMLPVVVLFAAAAAETITRRVVAAIPRVPRAAIVAPVALAGVTAVLVLHPFGELLATNRHDAGTTTIDAHTRGAAQDWLGTKLRPGSRVLGDSETISLDDTRFDVERLNQRTHTLADYQNAGHRYLLVNARDAGLYRLDAARHPRESAFYQEVACRTRLVATFPRTPQLIDNDLEVARHGWPIHVYRLDRPPRKVSDYLCTQRVGD